MSIIVNSTTEQAARQAAEKIVDLLGNRPDDMSAEAVDAVAAIIAAELAAARSNESVWEQVGTNLLLQLVGGDNALREFEVFQCNVNGHDDDCQCFWEQCEAWAARATAVEGRAESEGLAWADACDRRTVELQAVQACEACDLCEDHRR